MWTLQHRLLIVPIFSAFTEHHAAGRELDIVSELRIIGISRKSIRVEPHAVVATDVIMQPPAAEVRGNCFLVL